MNFYATIAMAVHVLIEAGLVVRVLTKPHRVPASRIAWVAVITALPVVGLAAYVLFGETSIGRKRLARLRSVEDELPAVAGSVPADEANYQANVPPRHQGLFHLGSSISGFDPVGGNSAELMEDSNTTIEAMMADIDAAEDHVHLLFYIWLPDNNGCKIVEALKRAAARGVTCRAMADALGSQLMLRSEHWTAMQEAGVKLGVALPIGNPLMRLLRPFNGRVDLRNHRKIMIIDGRITYCGSQNCADPEFLVKPKYAPWVDAMVRFEGPIARQKQHVFVTDWMTSVDEDISDLLRPPVPAPRAGFTAQVIGTGPTVRFSAMPEMFSALIAQARQELVISTPYFVPNEEMQSALCAAGYRGVKATIIFPARCDSKIVAAASRSYYADLLEAGVTIYEYVGGLLHTKSLTLDGEVTLIGSANMDRRSFDLNYENNILLYDAELTADVRQRQQEYIYNSNLISREMVESWSLSRRLWNNTLAVLGPIL
jgi:cardiolipin synthase